MIIGFYNIGVWLGSAGVEHIETSHKSVVAKELESYDCFQPFPRPVLGEYKNWLINHIIAATIIILLPKSSMPAFPSAVPLPSMNFYHRRYLRINN